MIWLGDLNYRIDLDNAAVRFLAESEEFDALVAADQVCLIKFLFIYLLTVHRKLRSNVY